MCGTNLNHDDYNSIPSVSRLGSSDIRQPLSKFPIDVLRVSYSHRLSHYAYIRSVLSAHGLEPPTNLHVLLVRDTLHPACSLHDATKYKQEFLTLSYCLMRIFSFQTTYACTCACFNGRVSE